MLPDADITHHRRAAEAFFIARLARRQLPSPLADDFRRHASGAVWRSRRAERTFSHEYDRF